MIKQVMINRVIHQEQEWAVKVPDDMTNERIEELIQEEINNGNLDLESDDADDTVEISIPKEPLEPDFTLTEHGIEDKED